MKTKKVAAAAIMGVMLTFTGVSQAFGAQWVCQYNHENCQGQEYCEQHRDCVENGYCIHGEDHDDNCMRSTTSTTNTNTSHHSSNRGCGGHRGGGHHR